VCEAPGTATVRGVRHTLTVLVGDGRPRRDAASGAITCTNRAVFDVSPPDQVRQVAEIAGSVVEVLQQDSGTADPATIRGGVVDSQLGDDGACNSKSDGSMTDRVATPVRESAADLRRLC
jgi:hypothetical protein